MEVRAIPSVVSHRALVLAATLTTRGGVGGASLLQLGVLCVVFRGGVRVLQTPPPWS
jgi:hypothetical protein